MDLGFNFALALEFVVDLFFGFEEDLIFLDMFHNRLHFLT